MTWWRAELVEWFVCAGRQFKVHVIKHEVLVFQIRCGARVIPAFESCARNKSSCERLM